LAKQFELSSDNFRIFKHQEALYLFQRQNNFILGTGHTHTTFTVPCYINVSKLVIFIFAFVCAIIIHSFKSFNTALLLPQFPILFFCRDFNHTWFINNSSCSVSLLNNSNNPGLITFLLLNILAVCSSLLPWQANK